MIVLGIDPGTERVGYGVLSKENGILRYVEAGVFTARAKDQAGRLCQIESFLTDLVLRFCPTRAGVEKLFFTKNKKTAMTVSEARGVIISVLAKNGVDFFEFTPPQVKVGITGSGIASKSDVAKMAGYFLKKDVSGLIDDATDALAIAIITSYKL